MCCPGVAARGTSITSPRSSTSSTGTTASAPSGPTPPVVLPGRNPEGDGQLTRRVSRAQREAVHRRAGERGKVDAREGGSPGDTAHGLGDRDGLRVERLRVLENPFESLLDRQEGRHELTCSSPLA
jgi:hypothetical protein